MNDFNEDSIKKDFIKYLTSLGITPASHKNYKSDISHFSGWLVLKLRTFGTYIEGLTEAVPFLAPSLAIEYKSYMQENKVADKTVNRRLSTLRHLSKFLLLTQIIEFDFMEGIENLKEELSGRKAIIPSFLISEFKEYLRKEKVSHNTIKNYLSDTRQFLAWLEANHYTLNPKP